MLQLGTLVQLQDTTDQLPAGQPEEEEVTVAYQRDVAERLQKFFEARETYKWKDKGVLLVGIALIALALIEAVWWLLSLVFIVIYYIILYYVDICSLFLLLLFIMVESSLIIFDYVELNVNYMLYEKLLSGQGALRDGRWEKRSSSQDEFLVVAFFVQSWQATRT